jgi:hypothetical protein
MPTKHKVSPVLYQVYSSINKRHARLMVQCSKAALRCSFPLHTQNSANTNTNNKRIDAIVQEEVAQAPDPHTNNKGESIKEGEGG